MQPDASRRLERRGPDRPFHAGRRVADRTGAAGRKSVPAPTLGAPSLPATEVVTPDAIRATRPPLEVELATAGARARSGHVIIERPDPDFIQKLRAELLQQLPASRLLPAAAAREAGRAGQAGSPAARRGVLQRLAIHPTVIKRAPSWAAAIAAGLLIGIVGLAAARSIFTPAVPPTSQAVDAAGATLIRNGQSIDLAPGTGIQPGDEIRTAADGHAVVALGDSSARMAGGADVIVTAVTATDIALDQVAGRVYHRVLVPTGGTYVVTTLGVTWTARGTAFDLDREPEPAGGTDLNLLTIENSVLVTAPDISVTVPQGRAAEVVVGVGPDGPYLTTGPQSPTKLGDPWLVQNAAADVAAGFDPGVLANVVAIQPTATPSPTNEPTPSPTPVPTPSPSVGPSTEPSASPTDTPTTSPNATPAPTPKATPEPIQSLDLSIKACPGGTILDWSAASADTFDHYKTFRSTSATFGSPILVAGTTTSSRTATSGADLDATGTRFYRTYAYDAENKVVGKSDTRSAAGGGAPKSLALSVGQPISGQTEFSWTTPSLSSACGDVTKLVYSTTGNPNYGNAGTKLLPYSGDVGAHEVTLGSVPRGTWWFRVQVIRVTSLGAVVTAQSTPVKFVVP